MLYFVYGKVYTGTILSNSYVDTLQNFIGQHEKACMHYRLLASNYRYRYRYISQEHATDSKLQVQSGELITITGLPLIYYRQTE